MRCDVRALLLSRTRRALASGCDGVISSRLEVPLLRAEIDHSLIVISPGIRPVDDGADCSGASESNSLGSHKF